MKWTNRRASFVAWGVWAALVGLQGDTPCGATPRDPITTDTQLPSWSVVERAALDYFATLQRRRETDLLSRGDVEPLFAVLADLDWVVSDRREMLDRLLSDSDWMVRTLRTRQGTDFMRSLSQYEGGFESFDRMRELPEGKRQISALMTEPGGADWFKFLGTTSLGKKTLNKAQTRTRTAKTPATRLYTSRQVLEALRKSYDEACEQEAKALTQQPQPDPAPPAPRPADPSPSGGVSEAGGGESPAASEE